jgi:predicted nucleotide-binding protein
MLTVPRRDLQQTLADRIVGGEELVTRVVTENGFEEWIEDAKQWHVLNAAIIERSFNTDEEYRKYGQPGTVGVGSLDDPRQQYLLLREDLGRGIRFLRTLKDRLLLFDEVSSVKAAMPQDRGPTVLSDTEPAIFLVHGRDDAAKHAVARFVQAITGLEPTILAEQPDRGQTVIEKLEKHASEVSYAIVLATGDDEGRLMGEDEPLRPRARQNVILELGWFAGRLGRQKVALLYKPGVELPSDMGGVLYVDLDPGEGWKLKLAKEMRATGLPVDMNKV